MKQVTMMQVQEWDQLVEDTYGKPYSFQQQDGCKPRGTHSFSVPSDWAEDFENDTIEEEINGDEMGVSLKAWKEADPKRIPAGKESDWYIGLWWGRNFYPNQEALANDLHEKGKLPAGDYVINIDW